MTSDAYTKEEIWEKVKGPLKWGIVALAVLMLIWNGPAIKRWGTEKFYGVLASAVKIEPVPGFEWSGAIRPLTQDFENCGFEVIGCYTVNKFGGQTMAFVNERDNLYGILNESDTDLYWEMLMFYEDGTCACWSSKVRPQEDFPPEQKHFFFREELRTVDLYDDPESIDWSKYEPIPVPDMYEKTKTMREDKPICYLSAEQFTEDLHDYLWEYELWYSRKTLGKE